MWRSLRPIFVRSLSGTGVGAHLTWAERHGRLWESEGGFVAFYLYKTEPSR